jgi:O-antigen chain-terminating methyltransferase
MNRLRQYEPFISPISKMMPEIPALDLGCGRGEWLRVLSEFGLDGHGVDLDDSMLEAARSAGLNVTTDDALAHLAKQGDECLSVISAFHLVEHLPFPILQKIVAEAHRCLVPGGILILETPNPENIIVAATSFYLDPTHIRPVPPLLLSFLAEVSGFEPVKVVRLQEDIDLGEKTNLSILDVLGGVSPDYAIVAQKSGSNELARALATSFDKKFGLDLSTLASRYDAWIATRTDYISNRSLWEKLLFRSSGKPRFVIRRLLFHGNGQPRRSFESLVLDNNAQPRRAFRMWMTSREYQSLPKAFEWRSQ